jgi:hypothetical protein
MFFDFLIEQIGCAGFAPLDIRKISAADRKSGKEIPASASEIEGCITHPSSEINYILVTDSS